MTTSACCSQAELPRRPLNYKLSGGDWRLASSMFGRAFSASPRASAHEEAWGDEAQAKQNLCQAGLGSWEGHVPDFDSSQSEALRKTLRGRLFLPTCDGTGSAPAPNKSQLDQLQACAPASPKPLLPRLSSRRSLWPARPSAMACMGTGHGQKHAFGPHSGHHVAGCLKTSSGHRLDNFPPPEA